MATWILIILMIDGGVDHVDMSSKQSCIEAREVVMNSNNNKFHAYTNVMCIKK